MDNYHRNSQVSAIIESLCVVNSSILNLNWYKIFQHKKLIENYDHADVVTLCIFSSILYNAMSM